MALNFPASPVDGQIYYDTVSGNRYIYVSDTTKWVYSANNNPYTGTSNTQVLYNNNGSIIGANGLTFSANTLYANTINVTGYIYGNGAYLTGVTTNVTTLYNTTNSAFDKANAANVLAYNTGIGANAYTNVSTSAANNYAGAMANSANAYAASLTPDLTPAFSKANNAYIVANAAFDKANNAGSNTFLTINANSTNITATSSTDILRFLGDGINIETNTISKTITFAIATAQDYGSIDVAITSLSDYGGLF